MKDFLKILSSFYSLILIAAIICILLGSLYQFHWGPNSFEVIKNPWVKGFLIAFGCGLALFASVCGYREHSSKRELVAPPQPGNGLPKGKPKSGTYEHFRESVLAYLNKFKDRICREYSAHITFLRLEEKYDRVDLLVVSIRYNYVKTLSKKLKFKFRRIRDHSDSQQDSNDYEWVGDLDERDIESPPPSELYCVEFLTVNGADLLPNLRKTSKANDAPIEYELDIPQEINLDEPAHFHFEVRFPMELDSYWVIEFPEPTDRFNIICDFSEVSDSIEVMSQEFISDGTPQPISRAMNKKIIQLEKHQWIFPRNGIVFYWYSKKKNEA